MHEFFYSTYIRRLIFRLIRDYKSLLDDDSELTYCEWLFAFNSQIGIKIDIILTTSRYS